MKRDFDLIRTILLQIEAWPAGEPQTTLSIDSVYHTADVGEHLALMSDANLIEMELLSKNPLAFAIYRLTWEGHDFLEKARNDTIWKKVMSEAKTKGTSITMVILDGLLSKAAEKYAGLGGDS